MHAGGMHNRTKRADHKQPKATKSESKAPGNSDESLEVQQCLGTALPRSELKCTIKSTGGDKTSKKDGGRKKRHTHACTDVHTHTQTTNKTKKRKRHP